MRRPVENCRAPFFFGAHVDEHDDEKKEHHHAADVNQNLHARDKLRAEQNKERGHKYAIQISTDAPHPGGRTSGTVTDESLIYGKLARGATAAYVNCDATIALPILITALSQTGAKYMKGRKRPSFTFAGRELLIEVP